MDARRLAAPALAALALVSAAVGAPRTWDDLTTQRLEYGAMTEAEADDWAATYHRLDAAEFDFFASRLDADSRYYVVAPSGRPVGFFDEAGVARTWAAFRLLPALQVDDPRRADRVLGYGADVRDLELQYARVERAGGSSVGVVAR